METSKLEAVYFQPGCWENLHQPLRCLAWGESVPLPADCKRCLANGPQMSFYRFSHPTGEDRKQLS